MDEKKLMPEARASSFLYPLSDKSYILIGGSDRNKAYNDVWLLLPEDKKWESISNNNPISNVFTPRSGFSSVVTEKTSNNLTVYLHRGLDFFSQKFYADFFKININCNDILQSTVSNLIVFPINIEKNPCERNSHALTFDNDKLIYIFGGGTKESLLNDLWSYDIHENKFELIQIDNLNNIIEPRELFGMGYYNNNLIIIGGRLMSSIDNKSYIINLNEKKIKEGPKLPCPLCAFAYSQVKYNNIDYIILYGGTDGNNFFNVFVVYNLNDNTIKKSKFIINKELVNNDPNFGVFLGRISAIMTVDEINENIILYGGSASDKEWSYINKVSLKDIINNI